MSTSKSNKPELLFIVSRFPFPLEKGDKLRAYHQIRELSMYFDITLVAINETPIQVEHLRQLERYCKRIETYNLSLFSKVFNLFMCIFNKRPFQVGYFYSYRIKNKIKLIIKESNFKHIFCQLIRVSEYVKDEHHISKTFDYMDALSAGMQRRIDKQPFLKKWIFKIETKRLIKYEQIIFDYFENKIIISEQDRLLIQHPDRNDVLCIPNGIDASFFEAIETKRMYDFVFVGNMSYPPNIDAVHYVVDEILPSFPSSTFLIAGASPHRSIQAISNPNVTISGWVDDIRESYCSAKIFIAPMSIGTGMQNKLLEAMALKLPCITTSLANNAIHAIHNENIIVADTKDDMIEHINLLLNDSDLRDQIGRAGSVFVEKNYSWATTALELKELMTR